MSQPTTAANPYDLVPYPSKPVPRSHPDRLAAVAALFGMQPKPIDHCRVLELGCGNGGNLIPMAERHPESRFVGIDYSAEQVNAGQRLISDLQLENIQLECASIEEAGPELGRFDYIICHGVFSWVAAELQDRILTLCAQRLEPQGVAYVSYNLYPGWHLRMVLRDMLQHHAPPGEAASARLAKGRRLAKFLSQGLGRQPTVLAQRLKSHVDNFLEQPDGYVYHEDFEGTNCPVYFHDFVARAAGRGLQYLGEAALATMFVSNFEPAVQQQLARLAHDQIAAEQHLDVVRDRMFRQSLLCHQGIPLERQVSRDRLGQVRLCGQFRARSARPDLRGTTNEEFSTIGGIAVSSSVPLLKAALDHLGRQWPRAIAVDELIDAAAALIADEGPAALSPEQRLGLTDSLAKFVASGMIEPVGGPDSFVTAVSQRPQASGLARFEARTSNVVTNRRHEQRKLDDAARSIIGLLDGQHDHAAILRDLQAAVERGDVSLLVGGIPTTDQQGVAAALAERLNQCLTNLADHALLVA